MSETTITIRDKDKKRDGRRRSGRAPLLPPARRRRSYLPRRRRAGGALNFYDLGQVVSEAGFADLEYQDPATAGYEGFIDAILDVAGGAAGLKAKYRRIDRAMGDRVKIGVLADGLEEVTTSDNPNWTDEGLTLTDSDLARNDFRLNFSFFNEEFGQTDYLFLARNTGLQFTGELAHHITAERDRQAPAVPDFRLRPGDDLYLIPRLFFSQCRASTVESPDPADIYQMNYFSCPIRRTQFFDPFSINHQISFRNNEFFPDDPDAEAYDEMFRVFQIEKGRVGARSRLGSGGWGPAGGFLPPPFPTPPTTPTPGSNLSCIVQFVPQAAAADDLLSIVGRGANSFFYVWQN